MDHLVVAPTINGKLLIMKEGTRSECKTYIRRRVRNNRPTHFCYIIRNTEKAIERFKKKHYLN